MTVKIYCPLCEYHPTASDEWQCRPGCLTVWNTFETRARCPGCSKQWRETWCPACARASLHEAWYHEEGWTDKVEEREEELVGVG